MARVAAVGFDAAEWSLIERMVASGELPTLARLRQAGTTCRLRNPSLYTTTILWESFLASVENPVDARSGGVRFDPRTYNVDRPDRWNGSSFFSDMPGTKTVLLDVPNVSYVDGPGDAVVVWGGHVRSRTRGSRPTELLAEIEAAFGAHPASHIEHEYRWYSPEWIDAFVDALAEGARRRMAIASWLQDRIPDWNLLVVVMSEAHSAGESLWHGVDDDHPLARTASVRQAREGLLTVYRSLDHALGEFVAALPAETVLVVFALHGTGSNAPDVPSKVLLPELLYRLHFGVPCLSAGEMDSWRRAGLPPKVLAAHDTWTDYMRSRFRQGSRAFQLGTRATAHLPRPVSRWLLGRRSLLLFRSTLDWQVPTWYRRWWPAMRAFALPTFADGRVRINLVGRERHGVVPLHEYELACSEVEGAVRACRDPRTGRCAVEDIVPMRKCAPLDPDGSDADLVIHWSDALDAVTHPDAGLIGPFPFRRTAGHTPEGFAFFSGPGIPARSIGQRDALDMPATIVSLLGEGGTEVRGTSILSST